MKRDRWPFATRFDAVGLRSKGMLERPNVRPIDAEGMAALGICESLLLALTDRLDGAVAEYEKALRLDPMHSDSRTNLAAALARQGKLDRAARELAVLLENDPENAGARTNLGLVFLQQGRPADARRQFEEALRLDPGLTPAREALDSLGHQ